MIVLTGGPGSGKTSVANSLRQDGFRVAKESGRKILQSDGGMALRESNPLGYALAMLELDKQNFVSAIATDETTIYDRGIPDIAGYLELMNIPIPKALDDACYAHRYTGPIFAVPPWREIYRTDDQRSQSFEEACGTYDTVCSAWKKYGYSLLELPKMSVENRTDFILNNLS
ncbi:MAG: ATP-binding protein [Parasphingorhabdus sp.]